MKKQEIVNELERMIRSFKSLKKSIQKEESNVLDFLEEQLESIKDANEVSRYSLWHPQALFFFKDSWGLSVREYFEIHGTSIDNIEGIRDISVLDSYTNKYIVL